MEEIYDIAILVSGPGDDNGRRFLSLFEEVKGRPVSEHEVRQHHVKAPCPQDLEGLFDRTHDGGFVGEIFLAQKPLYGHAVDSVVFGKQHADGFTVHGSNPLLEVRSASSKGLWSSRPPRIAGSRPA